jgi:cytochrome b561
LCHTPYPGELVLAFDFGRFQVDFRVAKYRPNFYPNENLQGYRAYASLALAGVHALAALWHHFVHEAAIVRRT